MRSNYERPVESKTAMRRPPATWQVAFCMLFSSLVTPISGQDSAERRFAFADENGAIVETHASDPETAQQQVEGKSADPGAPRLQYLGEIIRSVPTPTTRGYDLYDGLTWKDEHLWYSPYRVDTLYELDPVTGTVLRTYPKGISAGGDIAWDGTHFWETGRNGLIWKYDPAMTSFQSFAAPGSAPVGIAWNGSNIWVCDSTTDLIYAIDRTNGSVVRSIPGPEGRMTGLDFDGEALWVGGHDTQRLYRIDPMTGQILSSLPSVARSGLAFDGRYLWAVGHVVGADWILQIDIAPPLPADPMIEWERVIGEVLSEIGMSVQQTPDGGYVVGGQSTMSGPGGDFYLLKTDPDGNRQWERTFARGNIAYCVEQTSDGGLALVGDTDSAPMQLYLVKTDSNGNQQWDRTFGSALNSTYGRWVEQTNDGGYIIGGAVVIPPADSIYEGSVYLLKTDSAGNMQWERTLGEGIVFRVQQTSDGGYIIGASISQHSLRLIKTDANGNLRWEQTYTGSYDWGFDVAVGAVRQSADSGYVITASYSPDGRTPYDVLLIKTDANGIMEWQRTFGGKGYESGYDVVETRDGGFLVAGRTDKSFNVFDGEVYLVKTDRHGNPQCQKTIGGGGIQGAQSIQPTADGGYIIVSRWISDWDARRNDVYLIKLRPEAPPPLSARPSWQLYK